ncbi:MAG TPA: low specificity L-threonine aldolase [Alphaproteobacteria bacterium]|nr:low specificity L-threonine aldolase [Alphaproteobacteria bacterium]
MNFCSDNTAGAHPKILEALAAANGGPAMPYGNDELTRRVERRIAELFERDCAVFLVGTGTSANALALAALAPNYGAVFCHPESHINMDECGAPEFFTGGAKLVCIQGAHAKIAAADLDRAIKAAGIGVVHHVQPAAVSITQATEAGAVYRPADIAAIAAVAHRHGLALHMDGARFANALVHLGCTPAEMTWRAGVDALSFGATKNGAFAAEAVVFFDLARAASFGFRRKRAGHLWSKMRFLAAQLDAYLTDELWLANARHANRLAAELARGLSAIRNVRIEHPVEANEVFVTLPEPVIRALEADGFRFYRWLDETSTTLRLVTSFETDPAHVAAFVASARRHASAAA